MIIINFKTYALESAPRLFISGFGVSSFVHPRNIDSFFFLNFNKFRPLGDVAGYVQA